jgi:hypothetical protein
MTFFIGLGSYYNYRSEYTQSPVNVGKITNSGGKWIVR